MNLSINRYLKLFMKKSPFECQFETIEQNRSYDNYLANSPIEGNINAVFTQDQRKNNGKGFFFLLIVASLIATNVVSAACVIDPVVDETAVTATVTNNRTYYLSEIGGCKNLVCWLDNVANTAFSNATLVVDQSCNLGNQTLTVPPRMVIAGVGMDGEGELNFKGLSYKQAAIKVQPVSNSAGVTIRDLRISGDDPYRGRGIELISAHQVNLERLRISGFGNGIYGRKSFSTVIDKVNLHENNINIFQDFTANTWRVTNSVLNQAKRWGIYQTDTDQNSSVYSGNRFESNGLGGIHVAGDGTVIQNNEFEGNGGAGNVGIKVHEAAVDTRILSNFYSGDCPIDSGVNTESAFDIFFFSSCP